MNTADDAPIPAAPPAPDVKPDEAPESTFTLSAPELAEAGLSDCQPGETYTATVNFRVSDSQPDDASKTFEVESVTDATPSQEPAAPSDESEMLGYNRPGKEKPFPEVKGLRG